MILKYEEYIKEGLWSKGIERSKSDVDRLEHKLTQSYVEDIFNPQKYYVFMRENKLYDVIKIFSDKLDNTYIDFIYNQFIPRIPFVIFDFCNSQFGPF